jgi:hypothetical protein
MYSPHLWSGVGWLLGAGFDVDVDGVPVVPGVGEEEKGSRRFHCRHHPGFRMSKGVVKTEWLGRWRCTGTPLETYL